MQGRICAQTCWLTVQQFTSAVPAAAMTSPAQHPACWDAARWLRQEKGKSHHESLHSPSKSLQVLGRGWLTVAVCPRHQPRTSTRGWTGCPACTLALPSLEGVTGLLLPPWTSPKQWPILSIRLQLPVWAFCSQRRLDISGGLTDMLHVNRTCPCKYLPCEPVY